MTCNRMPDMGSPIYMNGCSCNCLWNEMQGAGNNAADSMTTAAAERENQRENRNAECMPNSNFGAWPVGMTYVPMQPWEEPFDLAKGLRAGTIFPSLRLPFKGGGR